MIELIVTEQTEAALIDDDNPWPGLESFTEEMQEYFNGRKSETEELFRIVKRGILTVLFGRSGLGKSSLLRAGLFPLLRAEYFFPVYIRLSFAEGSPLLMEQVRETLKKTLEIEGIEAPQFVEKESLWAYFHRVDVDFWNSRHRLVVPVLVFDQFEEFFSLGGDAVEDRLSCLDFLRQLSDLVENRCPDDVLESLNRHTDQLELYNFDRQPVKIIISLREDFLANLEDIKEYVHPVLQNRMRILQMNREQALEVVQEKGGHLLEKGVAERIVQFVACSGKGMTTVKASPRELAKELIERSGRHLPKETAEFVSAPQAGKTTVAQNTLSDAAVEPALLSLVCRELNNRRLRKGLGRISDELLCGSCVEILEDFYERSLKDIPVAVQTFIEDKLLTASGYRQTAAMEDALENPEITRDKIELLVKRRLLRFEERFGVPQIELIHDLLTDVVRHHRDQRRQQDSLIRQQEKNAEVERIRRLRRMYLLTAVFATLCIVAVAGVIAAIIQTRLAIQEKKTAQSMRRSAEDNFRIAKNNFDYAEKKKAEAIHALDEARTAKDRAVFAAMLARKAEQDAKNARAETKKALASAGELLQYNSETLWSKLSEMGKPELLLSVAEKSKKYYDSVASIKDAPANFADNRIYSSMTLGDITSKQATTDKAFKAYKDALELIEKRSINEPEKIKWHYLHSSVSISIGRIMCLTGKRQEGWNYYDRADNTLGKLIHKYKDNSDLYLLKSVLYSDIGDYYQITGSNSAAIQYYHKSLDAIGRAFKISSDDKNIKIQFAQTYNAISYCYMKINNFNNANTYLKKSTNLIKQLRDKYPKDRSIKWEQTAINNTQGDWLVERGRRTEAVKHYTEMASIWSALVTENPDNISWDENLLITCDRFSDMLIADGRIEDMSNKLPSFYDLADSLAKIDRANLGRQANLASFIAKGAQIDMIRGNYKGAMDKYSRSYDISSMLVRRDPRNHDLQRALAQACEGLGDASKANGNIEQAHKMYLEEVRIAGKLVDKEPEYLLNKRIMLVGMTREADLLLSENKISEALNLYSEVLSQRRNIVDKYPRKSNWRRDLAISYCKLGLALKADGRHTEAKTYLSEIYKSVQVLVERDPQNADWMWDSGMTYGRFSDFMLVIDQALLQEPKDAGLWNLKGLACKTLLKNDEGLKAYNRAVELARKNKISAGKELACYLVNRARNHIDHGNVRSALADIQEARALLPDVELPDYLDKQLKKSAK